MNQQTPPPVPPTAAETFLLTDFGQCFTQLRHHDSQILDIMKFLLTGYTAVAGIAVGLHKFRFEGNKIDLTAAAYAVLCVGIVAGIVGLTLAIRNRIYFVKLGRYLNEYRELFLGQNPLGFENKSKMYDDPAFPPYLRWASTQVWLCFLIAALNSLLVTLVLVIEQGKDTDLGRQVGVFIIATAIQIGATILWLWSKDWGKKAAPGKSN